MEALTVFNLRAVNRGVLKATVSIQLTSGLIIHDCKILEQEGTLLAQLPQRSERLKGGEVVYHDVLEFADPQTWAHLAPPLVAYYPRPRVCAVLSPVGSGPAAVPASTAGQSGASSPWPSAPAPRSHRALEATRPWGVW